MRYFFFMLFLILPFSAMAGGPILVDTDGTGGPVLWQGGVVHINLENDPAATLGQLSNADAVALVHELFNDWQSITINGVGSVALTLDEGAPMGLVTVSNLNQHFSYCPPGDTCPSEDPPFVVGSARTGESPILFDTDGSMTDAVEGTGANRSILGFAGPRVVERSGGTLYITEGQAILNGRFINGVSSANDPEVSINQFKGAIFHEIGHMIGLDHTQVNLGSVVKFLSGDTSEAEAIPTMFPLFIDGEAQLTPHFDDKATLSGLYPTNDFEATTCTMKGKVFNADGTTELQGVNVIAASTADPLGEDTSSVSGSFYTGVSTNCDAPVGDFTIKGLRPGQTYNLSIEPISQSFTGGSSLEPCDPPQKDFSKGSAPGTFSCASAGEVITNGTEASTQLVTTKAVTTPAAPTTPTTSQSSSGGCSLVAPGIFGL